MLKRVVQTFQLSTISTFFSSSGSDANTDRATTSQDTCIPAVLTQDSSVQPVMLNSIEPFVVDRNITLTAEIVWNIDDVR